MNTEAQNVIEQETIKLIDQLKSTCQSYGLGNDGNEFKIITQVFLYKFLNDKFGFEIKKISKRLAEAPKWDEEFSKMSENERLEIMDRLSPDVPRLEPYHLIYFLWNQQAKGDFDIIFDGAMTDMANKNAEIFSTQTTQNTKIPLFEKITIFVTDDSQRADFARALIDKLAKFSFESAFDKSYDFFARIFEYLIKDYNTSGGGKYAEYYTPHSIATIMAKLLVDDNEDLHNIEVYDPSAGTGTLLMALAHQVGVDKCTVYSQDISQRSNKMLKLNLILNGLVASLDHAIQGDTLVSPYHKSKDGTALKKFDYIVSNPPFKMDFSDTREKISAQSTRFWAGVPKIKPKDKDKMEIYTCFIQHVINSLKDNGKGAIVVPTGFITASNGIEKKIKEKIVDEKIIYGVISMPSNVFATTGTNVSVLFFDKSKTSDSVILIDASKLGEEYKDGKLQRKRLRDFEIEKIINVFKSKIEEQDFSVVVSYEDIKEKKYSLSAGQYFEIVIEHIDISQEEFEQKMKDFEKEFIALTNEGNELDKQIIENLRRLKLE